MSELVWFKVKVSLIPVLLMTCAVSAAVAAIDEPTSAPTNSVLEGSLKETAPSPVLTPESSCRFPGRFTQEKILAGVSTAVKSSGRFLYDCDVGVIWEVQDPTVDSLVLRLAQHDRDQPKKKVSQVKSHAFRVVGDVVQPLKGRQSKFLTRLIMSLMSADQTALTSQFDILEQDSGVTSLVPRKRALKRAIKRIDVVREGSVMGDQAMTITMVDRNEQTTIISAYKGEPASYFSGESCESEGLSSTACALLFPSELAPQ